MTKTTSLLTGEPGPALIRFAIPLILGSIFQQFYNMADTVIVGHFVGEEALAAVGASYSFTNIFIMIAIGGGIGASVLTSQYFGAGDYKSMKTSIYTALITFLAVSVVLAGVGLTVNLLILGALKTPDNVLPMAVTYLQIYFLGLPFVFMYNVLSHNFNALGKSGIPLCLLIFSSVLNIFLDLFMVLVLRLGVAGVAIATVTAQGISALTSFTILMRHLRTYPVSEAVGKYDASMAVSGMKIAIPSIVQQSIASIGLFLAQASINRFGSAALAGYCAGSRVESLFMVPMIGIGNALSTYTAQNLGAGNTERVEKGLKAAYRIAACFALVLLVISQFFYRPVISAFADPVSSSQAYAVGVSYMRFCGCFYIILGLKNATDGVLRGSGDAAMYMIANLVNFTVRLLIAWYLPQYFGIRMIWVGIPVGLAANLLISRLRYRSGKWKEKKLISR